MSDLASSTCVAAPDSEKAAAAEESKKELADRLIALIDKAEARVRSIQKKAVTEFTRRQARLAQFAATRTRVNRIFNDRPNPLLPYRRSLVGSSTKPPLTTSVPVSVQPLNRG